MKEILSAFFERSYRIKDSNYLKTEYEKFAIANIAEYLMSTDILGNSLLFRALNKAFAGQLRKKLAEIKILKYRERLINQHACEAHREMILMGLEVAKK